MCGICGIYSFNVLTPESESIVRKMNSVQIHRGPDDEGYYRDRKIALGMRRLSIIDLVTGHQPISNESGEIWVIFNGEIYNFRELRQELEKKGHHFRTSSDTEVLIHLYEEKGENFLSFLNGMFAIALWDKKNEIFILARDRLGIKPLHYTIVDQHLFFSSEIKSLLQVDFPKDLNYDALLQYFTFEYIPAPNTIFKQIQKILPGHKLTIRNNKLKIERYWDVTFLPDSNLPKNKKDLASEIQERLKDSVHKRLVSDVPLGVFLSGGIDSSSITALMSSLIPGKVKTFSIGFKEESFNELEYARLVSSLYGTEHREFVVESSLVKDLVPRLIEYLDEPLADASIIPTYIISKLARQHVKVALSGDGGDELFAGYDTYRAYKIASIYRKVPKLFRDGIIKNLVSTLPASKKRLSFEFKAKKFISGIDFPPEIANIIWWGAYNPSLVTNLLAPKVKARTKGDAFSPVSFHLESCRSSDMLSRLEYLDLKLYLQDDLLVKVDRMSMANSLEIRVPFLDHNFVKLAASIPSSLKLKGFKSKFILKKAMTSLLPREILFRKKIGFDIPLGIWIRKELREFVGDILSSSSLKKHGFFNTGLIETLLKEHFDGKHNHRQLLWPLIIFQFWYSHYME